MRRHDIEMQKKFTLSFACLIFFFIGAPLGAIIKKGGIGTPLVISVFLFIVYFIFDNMGYKMARDGKTEVWMGIWLSSAVLLPLGIFFTYKAVGDSAVFNVDAYAAFFRRITGRRLKRSLELKEVIMSDVDPDEALVRLRDFRQRVADVQAELKKMNIFARLAGRGPWRSLEQALNDLIEYLSNSRRPRVVLLLNEYPFAIGRRNLDAVAANTEKLIQQYTSGPSGSDI